MKKNALMLCLIVLFPLVSCNREAGVVKEFDLGPFRVTVPRGWRHEKGQGYDSQIGKLTKGKNLLHYDFGWHAYRFTKETSDTHDRQNIEIDGKPALLVRPLKSGTGVMGVHIQVDQMNRLTIYGNNITDEATAKAIFESVRF